MVHFSCGATSAVAGWLTCRDYDTEVIYADTASEHPDNMRFLLDCEEKLFNGQKVKILKSSKYFDIFDVFERHRFLSGPAGAKCTTEMKKKPIRDYLGSRIMTELQVFGYDTGEAGRIERFRQNNPEVNLKLPLIERGLSKADCLSILIDKGIELPAMYKLGYSNSNCIGCVKGSLKYWAAIKIDFPEIFDWYAKFERQIGAELPDGTRKGGAINKRYVKGERVRVFLDELPDDIKPGRDLDISCGYSCGQQELFTNEAAL